PIPIPILGTIHIIGKNPLTWYQKNVKKAGTIWEFYIGPPNFLRGFVFSVQKLFKEYEDKWKLSIKDGVETDISMWIKFFTMDIAIIQITKRPTCSLVSFDTSNEIVPSEEEKKSLELANAANSFLQSLTLTIKQEFKEGAVPSSDLLDSLLMAHTLQNPEYNDDSDNLAPITVYEVNAVLWDVLLGGIGSTKDVFAFMAYNVAKNPKILNKIRKEIDEVFGSNLNDYFSIEKLINCRYIEAVVKESMRYIVPAPFTIKISGTEENIAGYNWPSGTRFWIDHQNISNNPDYWNDHANFNPDRFLNENHISNSFTLFGGGIRVCPGKNLAMNWLKTLTVLFYSKYNVKLVKEDENIKYHFTGANVPYDLK
ncbi:1546_t:CDS:2, partial [Dentiscutata erythropus]